MRSFHNVWAKVATKSVVALLAWKILIFALIFGNLWVFVGKEALPPNGTGFHLLVMFIAAYVLGRLTDVCKLTALFGMLIAGKINGIIAKSFKLFLF